MGQWQRQRSRDLQKQAGGGYQAHGQRTAGSSLRVAARRHLHAGQLLRRLFVTAIRARKPVGDGGFVARDETVATAAPTAGRSYCDAPMELRPRCRAGFATFGARQLSAARAGDICQTRDTAEPEVPRACCRQSASQSSQFWSSVVFLLSVVQPGARAPSPLLSVVRCCSLSP